MSNPRDLDGSTPDETEFLEQINYQRAIDAAANLTKGHSNNDLLSQLVAEQRMTNVLLRDQLNLTRDMMLTMNTVRCSMSDLTKAMSAMSIPRMESISSSTASLIALNPASKADKHEIVATVLMQVFNLTMTECRQRGIQYNCARPLDVSRLKQYVRVIMKMKNLPGPNSNDPSMTFVSQRIISGQKNAIAAMTLETLYDIISSNIALPIMSTVREVHRQLVEIKEIIPTVHGDVLAALTYPFVVSKDGLQLNCEWGKIVDRQENMLERTVAEMSITKRYKYMELVMSGLPKVASMVAARDWSDEKESKSTKAAK